jgi:hypothetical protein
MIGWLDYSDSAILFIRAILLILSKKQAVE